MRNERGYSWPETMLTLFIFIIIFGTIMPVAVKMQNQLARKEKEMLASEVLAQSAIRYKAYGETFGSVYRNGAIFQWEYEQYKLCVSYINEGTEKIICST